MTYQSPVDTESPEGSVSEPLMPCASSDDMCLFDIISIGCGPAGIAVSAMGVGMGLKVLTIDKRPRSGGECMNSGCIPSKAWLRAAELWRHAREMAPAELRDQIRPVSIVAKTQEDLTEIAERKMAKMLEGVTTRFGYRARFKDSHTVQFRPVDAPEDSPWECARGRRIFIATGTSPFVPNIPGLHELGDRLLTNESIFHTETPYRVAVLGGGAIACEMAEALSGLGCDVTVIQRSNTLLKKYPHQVCDLIKRNLTEFGCRIIHPCTPTRFVREGDVIHVELPEHEDIEVDYVLSAAGRKALPASALNLEAAGIEVNAKGYIIVDKHLRTKHPWIYAVGDCNGHDLLSHAAMAQGMCSLFNSMMPRPMRYQFKKYHIPMTTFVTPNVSSVGASAAELEAQGKKFWKLKVTYEGYGATYAMDFRQGWVEAYVTPLTGKFLGVLAVGDHSGELINEFTLCMQNKIHCYGLMMTVHSFPTISFGLVHRIGELWMQKHCESKGLQKMMVWAWRSPFWVSFLFYFFILLILALIGWGVYAILD